MTETLQLRGTLRGHNGYGILHLYLTVDLVPFILYHGPHTLAVQVGDPDHHQPQVPGHDPVLQPGQVTDRVEADPGGRPVRRAPEAAARPLPLHLRRGSLLGRPLRPVRLLGQDPQAVGPQHRQDHPQVC